MKQVLRFFSLAALLFIGFGGKVVALSEREGLDIYQRGYYLEAIEYWKKAPVWNPNSIKYATRDWFKYLS